MKSRNASSFLYFVGQEYVFVIMALSDDGTISRAYPRNVTKTVSDIWGVFRMMNQIPEELAIPMSR